MWCATYPSGAYPTLDEYWQNAEKYIQARVALAHRGQLEGGVMQGVKFRSHELVRADIAEILIRAEASLDIGDVNALRAWIKMLERGLGTMGVDPSDIHLSDTVRSDDIG